jgi:hypothetical protein
MLMVLMVRGLLSGLGDSSLNRIVFGILQWLMLVVGDVDEVAQCCDQNRVLYLA